MSGANGVSDGPKSGLAEVMRRMGQEINDWDLRVSRSQIAVLSVIYFYLLGK